MWVYARGGLLGARSRPAASCVLEATSRVPLGEEAQTATASCATVGATSSRARSASRQRIRSRGSTSQRHWREDAEPPCAHRDCALESIGGARCNCRRFAQAERLADLGGDRVRGRSRAPARCFSPSGRSPWRSLEPLVVSPPRRPSCQHVAEIRASGGRSSLRRL